MHNTLRYNETRTKGAYFMCFSKDGEEEKSNLGAEAFNGKLKDISDESTNNEDELFKQLGELNAEVKGLIPHLLQEINKTSKNNKCNVKEYEKKMSQNYPVYFYSVKDKKIPMLKIPSVRIVINTKDHSHIDYLKIKEMVEAICQYVDVAGGDFDNFSSSKPIVDDKYVNTISINVCCEYDSLKENATKIKQEILNSSEVNMFTVKLKPSFFGVPLGDLVNKKMDDKTII